MHFQVRQMRWICDFCGRFQDIVTTSESQRPEGWDTRAIGGFGLTDYTKTFECCEVCAKKVIRQDHTSYWLEDPPQEETCSQQESTLSAPTADSSSPSPTGLPPTAPTSARGTSRRSNARKTRESD